LKGDEVMRSDSAGNLRLVAVNAEGMKRLIPFVRAFYEHFNYPYDEQEKMSALQKMLREESFGRLWLIKHEGKDVGYVLLAFSFSLEFNGRIAFIDELFIMPSCRQKGVGAGVLKKVENICLRLGINVLCLESEAHNKRATALYARLGYIDHGRHLMSKQIKRNEALQSVAAERPAGESSR
jgi:GNAT superfamily N-acetyltransferase